MSNTKEVNKNDNFPFGLQQTFIGPPDTFLEKVIRSVGVPPALAKLINDQNEELESLREENINFIDTLDKFLTEMSDILHPNVEAAQEYNSLNDMDKLDYIVKNSTPNIKRSLWNNVSTEPQEINSSTCPQLTGVVFDYGIGLIDGLEDELEEIKSNSNGLDQIQDRWR